MKVPHTRGIERIAWRRRARRERALAAAAVFTAGGWLIADRLWPSFPLPDLAGLGAAFALGLAVGWAVGALWCLTLSLTLLPVAALTTASLLGGLLALVTVGPAAATGLLLGAISRQAMRSATAG